MEWLKATGIALLIAVVGLGIFIGVRMFLSGGAEDAAKIMAQKNAQIAAAKDLIKKSQNSKADPGLLDALMLLRRSGQPLEKLHLGCIDKSGKRQGDRCVFLSKIDLSPSEKLKLKPAIYAEFDLSGANLFEANLSWVNFKQADLREANLSTSKLYRTNFDGADLFKANLSGADFLYTDLLNANLSGANMAGVKNLRQARLDRACLRDPTQPPLSLPAGLRPPTKICR